MKQTVNFSQFCDAFHRMGRGKQFSRQGLEVLFDYLEEIDPDYELDVIALCCEYTEGDYEQIISEHCIDISDLEDFPEDEDYAEVCRAYLEDNTTIIGEVAGGFIYANF